MDWRGGIFNAILFALLSFSRVVITVGFLFLFLMVLNMNTWMWQRNIVSGAVSKEFVRIFQT